MKKTSDSNKPMKLWKLVLTDILLVGVILVVFAMFHHVIPAIKTHIRMAEKEAAAAAQSLPPTAASEPAASSVPTASSVPEDSAPTEPDLRTPWQKKFQEHFSDTPVMDDHSYRSSDLSIEISTRTQGEGDGLITYHVADIYIGSIDAFVTATAHNEMEYFDTQDVVEMTDMAQGILSISGDFLTYQTSGFLLRNGSVYVNDNNFYSICALFPDGTMETYDGGSYEVEEILSRDPLQVWSFGPCLLDESGKAPSEFDVSSAVAFPNPRSALGYYEPGHYCFVVADGRQTGYSCGMTIPELAQVFEDLGCTSAYNLDGGGSAVMVFNGSRFSRPSNGGDRELGDILVIREPKQEELP